MKTVLMTAIISIAAFSSPTFADMPKKCFFGENDSAPYGFAFRFNSDKSAAEAAKTLTKLGTKPELRKNGIVKTMHETRESASDDCIALFAMHNKPVDFVKISTTQEFSALHIDP